MPNLRKTINVFSKKIKSRKRALLRGSFTPLDIVRVKNNNLPTNREKMQRNLSREFQPVNTVNSDADERRMMTEIKTDDVRSDMASKSVIHIISKTDSDSEEVDFSPEKIEGTNEKSLTNTQKGIKSNLASKIVNVIPDTDSESDDIEFSQYEIQVTKDLKKMQRVGIQQNNFSDSGFELDIESDTSIDIVPNTYEEKKIKCVSREQTLSTLKKAHLPVSDHSKINKCESEDFQAISDFACTDTSKVLADNTNMKNEIRLKIQNSKYKPGVHEIEKLSKISVKMRHPALPQHLIESTAGTRTMKLHEKEEFEKFAALKQGKFDKTEDRIIKHNWETFCQDNNWKAENPQAFLFMKHENREFLMHDLENRKKFVRCLAHGLAGRSLYSVFQRFKLLFKQPHKSDRYTTDEDKQILQYMGKYSEYKAVGENDRPFADLAGILGRTRGSVWRRYRKLKEI